MRYNAPTGELPGSPYINGDRNAGIRGSIVPAEAAEFPQREIVHVIEHAGLTPSNDDLEQLRKAVAAMIAAATGGGDVSQYLLLSQARSRLPIFPEILSADNRINVQSPAAGSIQVPSSVQFLHRGIAPVSTSDYSEGQRTFATTGGKTYHLRWSPSGGFVLRDLSNPAYNPSFLSDGDRTFDSTFDDMLIARVITNSSNVPAITNLANSNRLAFAQYTGRLTDQITYNATMQYGTYAATRANNRFTYNFARTPVMTSITATLGSENPGPTYPQGIHGVANVVFNKVVSRYQTQFDLTTDWEAQASRFYAEIDFSTLV